MRGWVVYFLIRNHKIVYIGLTANLTVRLDSHLSSKKFTSVRWVKFKSREDAAKYEKRWIWKFKPVYNNEYKPKERQLPMVIAKKWNGKNRIEK